MSATQNDQTAWHFVTKADRILCPSQPYTFSSQRFRLTGDEIIGWPVCSPLRVQQFQKKDEFWGRFSGRKKNRSDYSGIVCMLSSLFLLVLLYTIEFGFMLPVCMRVYVGITVLLSILRVCVNRCDHALGCGSFHALYKYKFIHSWYDLSWLTRR